MQNPGAANTPIAALPYQNVFASLALPGQKIVSPSCKGAPEDGPGR
jgi:hypothetical protein